MIAIRLVRVTGHDVLRINYRMTAVKPISTDCTFHTIQVSTETTMSNEYLGQLE